MIEIPPFRLRPEPLNEEAAALPPFKWAPEEIGTRHQLGGKPQFLEEKHWPSCVHCREKMTFYGQLDSINDQFDLADCGLIQVFVCFDCYETRAIMHSY